MECINLNVVYHVYQPKLVPADLVIFCSVLVFGLLCYPYLLLAFGFQLASTHMLYVVRLDGKGVVAI